MRINHNISSMITQTALYKTQRAQSKTITRLSTGLRINQASDDAAGLGVSENLRTQVRGTKQAIRNTQDAISLLQIADGALEEQATILQRMRELVIQAKNDTYTQTERNYMGAEFGQLYKELDRIAEVTNFNGMQLFADSFTPDSPSGSPKSSTDDEEIWDAGIYGPLGEDDTFRAHHYNMFIGANYSQNDVDAFNGAAQMNSYDKGASNIITIQLAQMDAYSLFQGGVNGNPETIVEFGSGKWFEYAPAEAGWYESDSTQGKLSTFLKLIDGDTSEITGVAFAGDNVSGLERVNKERAHIGAMINRLEHTVLNLQNSMTNQQAAESAIRDTEYAAETSEFTKHQILTRSATSMLAQANMVPQSALQLVR